MYLKIISIKDFFISKQIFLNKKNILTQFQKDIKWKKVILFFSNTPFDHLVQRMQHLARGFHYNKPDYVVIYLSVWHLDWKPRFKKLDENFFEINSFWALSNILKKNNIALEFLFLELHFYYSYIKYFDYKKLIYDFADDYELFPINMRENFLNSIQKSDFVCYSSDVLGKYINNIYNDKKLLYIPNWVNVKDREIKNYENIDNIHNKIFEKIKNFEDCIGYYWAIESRLDYELIKKILQYFPKKAFLFIWKDWGNYISMYWLDKYKNFFYINHVEYKKLKYYSQYFDIAIIPFKINNITNAVSPVKFFEYLIQKKLSVVTNFEEITKHKDFCFVSKTNEEFIENIELALKNKNNSQLIEKNYQYAKNFDWNFLAKKILENI